MKKGSTDNHKVYYTQPNQELMKIKFKDMTNEFNTKFKIKALIHACPKGQEITVQSSKLLQ